MRIVVVGAGVIGLATAWSLARRGAEVTVVDKGPPAGAASAANAGWISRSLSAPVPAPGLMGTTIRWMADPASPFYIRPRPDLHFAGWLFSFWQHCRSSVFERGRDALADLNGRTLRLFDLLATEGVSFETHSAGLVLAFRSEADRDADLESFSWVERRGFGRVVVGKPEELEPALSDEIEGAFLVEDERHLDPYSFGAGLVQALDRLGVSIRPADPVEGIMVEGKRVAGVMVATPGGSRPIAADAVVIAAGAWTPKLVRPLGVRLPIEAGKGYALDFEPPPVELRRPVYLHDRRVGISPFSRGVRLAGTMELAGLDERIAPRRTAAIARAGASGLRGWPADVRPTTTRSGFRPLTPDGLPVIGPIGRPRIEGLHVASGHSMIGITLAPVTGELLAESILAGRTDDLLLPFRPDRFA